MRPLVVWVALLATLSGAAAGTTSEGRIAFSDRKYYKGGGDSWEIFVVRPDGRGLRQVTRLGKGLFDSYGPAWSPDGRRIAFRSSGHIFVIDAAGKKLRQLTDAKAADSNPAWSPKGGRIAFGRSNGIWTMRADGRQQHRLTRNGRDHEPAWSPNGRRIVFVRSKDVSMRTGDLWLVGANGGRARKLTQRGFDPSWSPDGRTIAFEGPSESGIFVINADGSGRHRLGSGEDPSWSPDGRRIAFAGGGGIYVMDADGRNRRQIVPGYPEMFGPAWGSG